MTINITGDYEKAGYDVVTDTATIMKEDSAWMKDLVKNINMTKDKSIIRQAEHDFHEAMMERYGGKIAGELLLVLWKACYAAAR